MLRLKIKKGASDLPNQKTGAKGFAGEEIRTISEVGWVEKEEVRAAGVSSLSAH